MQHVRLRYIFTVLTFSLLSNFLHGNSSQETGVVNTLYQGALALVVKTDKATSFDSLPDISGLVELRYYVRSAEQHVHLLKQQTYQEHTKLKRLCNSDPQAFDELFKKATQSAANSKENGCSVSDILLYKKEIKDEQAKNFLYQAKNAPKPIILTAVVSGILSILAFNKFVHGSFGG